MTPLSSQSSSFECQSKTERRNWQRACRATSEIKRPLLPSSAEWGKRQQKAFQTRPGGLQRLGLARRGAWRMAGQPIPSAQQRPWIPAKDTPTSRRLDNTTENRARHRARIRSLQRLTTSTRTILQRGNLAAALSSAPLFHGRPRALAAYASLCPGTPACPTSLRPCFLILA